MIGRLNHVAIAVKDLEASTALYRDTLGARVSHCLLYTSDAADE